MANQLTNNSVSDLGLQSLPIFDTFIPNRKPLSYMELTKAQALDENNTNESNSMAKLDSPQESNDFSKRMGFLDTLSQKNQSIPYFDPEIRKYSKQKIIPKPYPYSSGSSAAERSGYVFPNSDQTTTEADRLFSSRHIKPDWNRFEDSIDSSLTEPKSYYPTKENVNNDEKSDDNSYSTEDNFETEPQNESNDYNEPQSDEPEEPDMSEVFDIDDDKDDDKDEREDKDDDNLNDYKYKEDETPECAFGHSFCYSDDQYPEDYMRRAVDKQMDVLTQILPESTDTFDLVEGIPKEKDENYTYIDSEQDLYNSESTDQSSYSSPNRADYRDGGYICPSYVNYVRPKRAQNNDGLWKVILNLNDTYRGVDYSQHIRIEECVYGKIKCSFAPNYVKSECLQKYSNERLLAWTPDKGIHLDVFRLPIACSCHLALNSQNTEFDKK